MTTVSDYYQLECKIKRLEEKLKKIEEWVNDRDGDLTDVAWQSIWEILE